MVFQTDVLINTSQITVGNRLSIIPDRFGTNEYSNSYCKVIILDTYSCQRERSGKKRNQSISGIAS